MAFIGRKRAAPRPRKVTHAFTTVGRKDVILTQTEEKTGKQFRLEGYIMVKYVRREIRSLHDEDVKAFFDAMETLYRLPTSQGVHQFGSEYKGIEYFVQLHLDGAGVEDCDHWHDDAGIMTHHVGYTLQFEQALQLVDPSVSIPYWEYTIEDAMGLDSYGESPVFADDWFGEFSPDNELHTVTTGRWAYLSVMEDAWDYVHNPYGLLRSPWNLDSTPYVRRHNLTNGLSAQSLVSCDTTSSCFQSSTISIMNRCLNGDTHGPVHVLTGGEWGNPLEEFIQKLGVYMSVPLVSKFLWRKGWMRIPPSCTAGEECVTTCPARLYESRNMTPYDVLMDVHAITWLSLEAPGIMMYDSDEDRFHVYGHEDDREFEEAFWMKLLEAHCNVGNVGEMYTSSAPYDPLFWVLHPTADRLLGWRRMLGREEPGEWEFDETWGYRHTTFVGESGMVCRWDGVTADSNDLPTCLKETCGGHNEDDTLPFKIKVNGEVVQLTNGEWMDLIYPTNEHLPYMYDEYSWSHCTAGGSDFGT